MARQPPLAQAVAALKALRFAPRAATVLRDRATQAAGLLCETIIAEVPVYSLSGNPEILRDLEQHARAHADEIVRLIEGGEPGAFDFVREYARRRADQRFPLEAMLQAYACGHSVLPRWMRDAAGDVLGSSARRARGTARDVRDPAGNKSGANAERLAAAVTTFSLEYTNTISFVCAAEYVAHTRSSAETEGDRRSELLDVLLRGYDESDARLARLLERAGYLDQRITFCVALVRSADPAEMESPPRVQRIIEAVSQAMATLPVRALVGVRGNTVTVVLSDVRRMSGWTAPHAPVCVRARKAMLMLGPAVLVGISTDQPSSAFVPKGLAEAEIALDFATLGERVLSYSELSIRRLLLHRAGSEIKGALPAWMNELEAADKKLRGTLIQTLKALADADLNVQQAARKLRVHANTLYARMEKISQLTGLDCRRYHDMSELLLAVDCRSAI